MGMGFFLGWFLSVAWLMLMTQLTCRMNDRTKQQVQGIMIALWIVIGVIAFLFR